MCSSAKILYSVCITQVIYPLDLKNAVLTYLNKVCAKHVNVQYRSNITLSRKNASDLKAH